MPNALIAQLNNPAALLQLNKRLSTIFSVLLVVACAYILVEITWLVFPQEDETAIPVQQKNNVANNSRQQQQFRQLTSSNIFGLSQSTGVVQTQTKVPETRLNLSLRGVLAAKPMHLASAIIAEGRSAKEEIYSVGDKLQGGVLIKEIHPEHVVLERNGRIETLKLEKRGYIGGGIASTSKASSTNKKSTPAKTLVDIRRNILKNPASFGEYALPVVVKENGKQIGYRLSPQEKGDMLGDLGLQASDVITEINGVALDKPQNGISALRKLSTAKNLNIVVKRNGADIPLNISLQ